MTIAECPKALAERMRALAESAPLGRRTEPKDVELLLQVSAFMNYFHYAEPVADGHLVPSSVILSFGS